MLFRSNLTNKPPVQGAIFCLAYVRGMQPLGNGFGGNNNGEGRGGNDAAFDRGHDNDNDRGDDLDRAVVITAETEPDFSSGPAAWTPDEGRTWFPIPGADGFWAVAFANPHAGWFVGNNGQILKISF